MPDAWFSEQQEYRFHVKKDLVFLALQRQELNGHNLILFIFECTFSPPPLFLKNKLHSAFAIRDPLLL